MTRVSIWVARRPEDELADAIAAADRRKTMDNLKVRHSVVVDNPAPSTAAGECRWCPTRRQLASMPDGASRLPQFGRLVASAAGRRAVGKPCERCVKTALGTLKRRVDAGRPQTSGGTRGASNRLQPDVGARASHHVNPGTTGRKHHDPLGTCSTCREYRRIHPNALMAGGSMPVGCPPHPWNEKPRPPIWAR